MLFKHNINNQTTIIFMTNTFIIRTLKFAFVALFVCSFTSMQAAKLTDMQAMVKALEWQEQHPIFAIAPTDWTNGAYFVGVTKAYQATNDPKYFTAIKNTGYYNKWEPYKRTFHADDIIISYSYIFASTTRKDLVDLSPTKKWIDTHLYELNQWKNGQNPMQKILWWWCDALFMAPTTITYYAKVAKEPKYLDDMHKYYLETYNYLFDKEENLFARDYSYQIRGDENDKKEPNGKKIFWSRGNGWVLGGLAIMLEDMPKDFKHYGFYSDLFKTLAKRVKELQPADGLWRASMLCPETYKHGEMSGSGFFTYALAWGINNGLLDEAEYKPAVLKAWKAMRKCQHADGMVGWVQDIGASPKPAKYDSWQNYGTGAFLMAGSEVIKFKK